MSKDHFKNAPRWFTHLAKLLVSASQRLSELSLAILLFLVAISVAGRYFFRMPIPGTEELSGALVILVVFLGLAFGFQEHRHIRVTLFTRRLNQVWQKSLALVCQLITLAFTVIMVTTTVNLIETAFTRHVTFQITPLPYAVPLIFMAIGLCLVFIALTIDFIANAKTLIATCKFQEEARER